METAIKLSNNTQSLIRFHCRKSIVPGPSITVELGDLDLWEDARFQVQGTCSRSPDSIPTLNLEPETLSQHLLVRLDVLQHFARTADNGCERIFGDVHRDFGAVSDEGVQAFQHGAATGQHDAAFENV